MRLPAPHLDPVLSRAALADEICDWKTLVHDVSAETPGLHAGTFVPDGGRRPPDYDHITWWMVGFMPR